MKCRLLTLCCFFCFFIVFNYRTNATHSMGADLTYTCISGNTYKLRLTFYRDCYGVAAPVTPSINVYSASCGESLTVYLDAIPGTGQEITPICPSATSTCNGGTFTGIEEWIYEGTVTLPAQCTDWDFSYDLCCRNQAITTLTNPLNENLYIHSTLNNTISPCNNSPTFTNKPVPFVCLGQQFCFNHGAYDVDGDSLAFSLMTPLSVGGAPVTYFVPYSATQPLISVPSMTFDPLTGDFCATPQQIEVTVMAVLVKEYRNGILIGQVERDMQITVIPCTNTLPTLTGINGTGNYTATICADEQFCFNVFSNDPDAGQNVSISWDTSIIAGTFNVNGSPYPTGTFCWTPGQADVSATAHCFTVRVWDDACPYFGSQVFSYCLTVVNLTADAGPDQSVACTNTVTITAIAGGTPGNYIYQWSNGSTTAFQSVGTGTYTVTVSNGLCTATDEVNILPLAGPVAAFNSNGGCSTLVDFTDQTTITSGSITGWSWDFGDGNTSSLQSPSYQYSSPGTYNVCLIVSSSVGCNDTICQPVTVSLPPVAGFNATGGCEGTATNITDTSTPAGSIAVYNWDFGNGTTSTLQNPSLVYAGASAYTITLIATDTAGCADTIQQQVVIYPLPVAAFTINYIACQAGPATFTDNSSGTITSWNWDFGDGQTSTMQNPTNSYNSGGAFNITLIVTTADGCLDTISQPVNIIPPIVVTPGLPQSICDGQQATISASGGTTYQWSDGQSGSSITVSPGTTTTYTVTVTDANGCSDTTSVLVTVFPLPQLVPDPDVAICNGQSTTLNVSGAAGYVWSTGETTASITVTPSSSAAYSVTGTDGNGCTASATINVTVNNPPVVTIQDIAFCDGENETLDAGLSGMSYLWNDGQTVQIISVTQSGAYTVTVTDVNGCSDTASALVTVFPLPQLVPDPDVAICNGENATLNINGAVSYIWSTGETTSAITVAPSSTTAYSVTGTDANGCTATVSINVTVNIPPVATVQDMAFCEDENGVLDAGISGMSYLWNSGQTTQTIIVSQAGTYMVTVTDVNGCYDTAQAVITVFTLPQLTISPDQAICDGETISISVNGAGSYIWSTGETTAAINVSPSTATSYSVTGTDMNGCEATASVNIIVNSLPVVSVADVSICPGDSAVLDAVLAGLSYVWSTGQTMQDITVSQAGAYTVTVTDANGCTDTAQASVIVFLQPQISAGSDQDICRGESIVLTATGGVSYIWNTGDSIPAINVSPLNNTAYSVIGTDANGCMDTAYVSVTIHNLPQLNIPNSLVCPGSSTTLNAGHPGATFLWSTGQTTQSIVVSQPGSYTVTITNSWGCSASQTIQVAPGGSISNNNNIVSFCMGDSSLLDAGNPGNTYLWTPGGETTQIITVSVAGPYSVIITNPNGCSGIVNSTVIVNPLPSAGFAATGGCAGQPVNFMDTTSISLGSISQWSWDFGDGNTSLQQNPVHAYSSSGSYLVVLTVVSDSGCTSAFSQNINTAALPVANFSSAGVCMDMPVQFTDVSTGGNITSWGWNFGDGTTASTQNPQHSYTAPGTYSVTLTVYTSNGCTDSKIKQVIINSLPDADFTASTVCLGFTTSFTDLSSDSTGTINSWTWNFGDGNASSQLNPSHMYSQSGSFTVQLVVTSSYGCVDTVIHAVFVKSLPVANAGPDQSLCQGQPVTLTASGGSAYLWSSGQTTAGITVNPGSTTTYIVTVTGNNGCENTDTVTVGVGSVPVVTLNNVFMCTGNAAVLNAGNSGSSYSWSTGETTQSISVAAPGNYSVVVTNVAGCTGTAQANITVGGSGLINNLNNISTCPGQSVSFNAGNPGNIFLWSTGATSQAITINTAGIYTVTVTDTSGCAASFTANLTINPLPVAGFSSNPACLNDQTFFTNSSTVFGGNIIGYSWNFGDGGSSQQENPVHTYSATGNFIVTLMVTSGMGCTDSISMPVHVYAVPAAAFTAPDECMYNPIMFTDNSSVLNDSISGWAWNFGDGTTAGGQNISHQYNNPGTYQALLVVTTMNGCSDSLIHPIEVYPVPMAGFTAPPVCEINPVLFTDTSAVNTGIITSWNWNFGDNTSGVLQNPAHSYAYGIYNAALIVTSDKGCTDTALQNIMVYPVPVAGFTTNDVCLGNVSVFNNQSGVPYGTINSNWDFGDGNLSPLQNPSHSYQGSGIFNVLLTVTSNNGCTAFATDPAIVYNLPVAQFIVNDVCLGQPAVFTDQSSSASGNIVSRSWDFGDGTTDTVLNPLHNYAAFGIYPVTLSVTSAYGCTDNHIDTVTIFRLPEPVIAAANGCITDPVTFTDVSDTALTGTVAWLWDFGDGTGSNSTNPVHTYISPGTYTVTLIAYTANGCEAHAAIPIEIYPVPDAGFSNENACAGDAVQFANTSIITSGTIAGYQWSFGDSSAVSTAVNPAHVYLHAGVYTVILIATSNNGCRDTALGQVTIFNNPVTNFVFDHAAGCGPLTISFTDFSYVQGSTIISWQWNFGDGETDSVQNPVHTYFQNGIYDVTLNTVTSDGCTGTITIPDAITIYPDPIAAFTPDPYESNVLFPVTFINHSIGAVEYQWSFGDGAYSDLESPNHLYNDTGMFVITLIVINEFGCPDTAIDHIRITPTWTFYVPNAFSPNNDGNNDVFDIYGVGIKEYELIIWNRWGEMIFTGKCGWNGMDRKSNYVIQDVYIYQVHFTDIFSEKHERIGRVTVIR